MSTPSDWQHPWLRISVPLRAVPTALLLATLLVGCQTLTGQTAGENVEDARITLAIKTALAKGQAVTLTRIGVKTVRGVVYLTGVVDSPELKRRATEIGQQFEGVRRVENDLEVQPSQ